MLLASVLLGDASSKHVTAQEASADPRFGPCRAAHAALRARHPREAVAALEPVLPALRAIVAAEPVRASTLAMCLYDYGRALEGGPAARRYAAPRAYAESLRLRPHDTVEIALLRAWEFPEESGSEPPIPFHDAPLSDAERAVLRTSRCADGTTSLRTISRRPAASTCGDVSEWHLVQSSHCEQDGLVTHLVRCTATGCSAEPLFEAWDHPRRPLRARIVDFEFGSSGGQCFAAVRFERSYFAFETNGPDPDDVVADWESTTRAVRTGAGRGFDLLERAPGYALRVQLRNGTIRWTRRRGRLVDELAAPAGEVRPVAAVACDPICILGVAPSYF